MPRRATILRTVLAVGLLGAIVLAVMLARHPFDRSPIDSAGGRAMRVAEIPTPHFTQTDHRWATDRLGPTSERMSLSGCTVCCVSMAIARYGIDIPPGELNRRLEGSGGFTAEGWLKWTWVEKLTGGAVEVELPSRPAYDDIDAALDEGWPVIAKIRLEGAVTHWVLIVAKEGYEYLARDPLVDRPLVPVSSRSSVIEAIRVIRPAD
jgi:hypothetical protein